MKTRRTAADPGKRCDCVDLYNIRIDFGTELGRCRGLSSGFHRQEAGKFFGEPTWILMPFSRSGPGEKTATEQGRKKCTNNILFHDEIMFLFGQNVEYKRLIEEDIDILVESCKIILQLRHG